MRTNTISGLLLIIATLNTFLLGSSIFRHKKIDDTPTPWSNLKQIETAEKIRSKPTLEFVNVPVSRTIAETGTIYADVLSHSIAAPFGDKNGRVTNVHETTHQINSEVRNANGKDAAHLVNAFYCLNGKAVLIEEPTLLKSDINKYVPEQLRGPSFPLYLESQMHWNNRPLYILDEFAAYVLGGKCAVDDIQTGRLGVQTTKLGSVRHCLEFSIYSSALCMAVKEKLPFVYWNEKHQLRAFVSYMLREANATFLLGHNRPELYTSPEQKQLLKNLLTSQDADVVKLRDFMRAELDDSWFSPETRALLER